MTPPENAVVVSVDEKTQIQALSRTQPVQPLAGQGLVADAQHRGLIRHVRVQHGDGGEATEVVHPVDRGAGGRVAGGRRGGAVQAGAPAALLMGCDACQSNC